MEGLTLKEFQGVITLNSLPLAERKKYNILRLSGIYKGCPPISCTKCTITKGAKSFPKDKYVCKACCVKAANKRRHSTKEWKSRRRQESEYMKNAKSSPLAQSWENLGAVAQMLTI